MAHSLLSHLHSKIRHRLPYLLEPVRHVRRNHNHIPFCNLPRHSSLHSRNPNFVGCRLFPARHRSTRNKRRLPLQDVEHIRILFVDLHLSAFVAVIHRHTVILLLGHSVIQHQICLERRRDLFLPEIQHSPRIRCPLRRCHRSALRRLCCRGEISTRSPLQKSSSARHREKCHANKRSFPAHHNFVLHLHESPRTPKLYSTLG